MPAKLLSVVEKSAFCMLIVAWMFSTHDTLQAQTVLLPGDIQIATVNSGAEGLDLLPLTSIAAGTELHLGNGMWDEEKKRVADGETILIAFQQDIEAGTLIRVDSTYHSIAPGSSLYPTLSKNGRLFLFQREEEVDRVLVMIQDEAKTTAIPAGLGSENHLLIPDHQLNYQYHLVHGASGTLDMLRSMLSTTTNWRSAEKPFPPFQTSFRILKPPVIQFADPLASITEGDTLYLGVSIFEHDGSKLTVDARFQPEQSTADSSELSGFKAYTFNFTGLIGSADYAIPIPIQNDGRYRGTRTAMMILEDLSSGSLGDFVYHPVFIHDDEHPELILKKTAMSEDQPVPVSLVNKESETVSLSGWKITYRKLEIEFDGALTIAGGDEWILKDEDGRKRSLKEKDRDTIVRLLDPDGIVVSTLDLGTTTKPLTAVSTLNADVPVETISASETPQVSKVLGEAGEVSGLVPGWYRVPASFTDSVFTWDESQQRFRLMTQLDETYPGIAYLDARPEVLDSIPDLSADETSGAQVFQISATDTDENGVINDAEGFNLLVNSGSSPIVVHTLLKMMEQQTGDGSWYPYAFLYEEERLDPQRLTVLEGHKSIPPGGVFWIRADSVITPRKITYIRNEVPDAGTIIKEEPYSGIEWMISNDSDSSVATVLFFERDDLLPRNVMDPVLATKWYTYTDSFLDIAIRADNVLNDRISLPLNEPNTRIFPLKMISSDPDPVTLSIKSFEGIPEDWMIQLYDRVEDHFRDIEPMESIILGTPESDQDTDGIFSFGGRYELHIIPPDIAGSESDKPNVIDLGQNYPNPFNPRTTISIFLPETERIRLSIFNIVGQPIAELVNGTLPRGEHTFEWDATGLPSGMYIYQMETETQVLTKKMTLVK